VSFTDTQPLGGIADPHGWLIDTGGQARDRVTHQPRPNQVIRPIIRKPGKERILDVLDGES
jgi:hypothetical protein